MKPLCGWCECEVLDMPEEEEDRAERVCVVFRVACSNQKAPVITRSCCP